MITTSALPPATKLLLQRLVRLLLQLFEQLVYRLLLRVPKQRQRDAGVRIVVRTDLLDNSKDAW